MRKLLLLLLAIIGVFVIGYSAAGLWLGLGGMATMLTGYTIGWWHGWGAGSNDEPGITY